MPLNLHLTCCYCEEWCDDDYVEVIPFITAHKACAEAKAARPSPDAPMAAIERYLERGYTTWADRAKQAHTDGVVAAYRAGYKAGFRAAEGSDGESEVSE